MWSFNKYLKRKKIYYKLIACHLEVFTDTWKQDYISNTTFLLCCYIHLGDMFRLISSHLQAPPFFLKIYKYKRYTSDKALCSASKVPLILNRSRSSLQVSWGRCGKVPDVGFHENPFNGRWNSADKELTSSTKVHFIIDQSRPKVQGK